MRIVRLAPDDPIEYFKIAAQIHVAEIHHGLLPLLGIDFLTQLYRGIAGARRSAVWVAMQNDKVMGFIAGCAHTKGSLVEVLVKHGGRLLFAAGTRVWSRPFLRKLPAVIAYPFNRRHLQGGRDYPQAELLAIGVAPSARGKGMGRQLVEVLETSFTHWGAIQEYHVKTNSAEPASNSFYQALGFAPSGTVPHHDLVLRIYTKRLSTAVQSKNESLLPNH